MSKERPPLEEMTLRQLRRVASECGVSRYSRMRKDQLLAAIQTIQAAQGTQGTQGIQPVEATMAAPTAHLELPPQEEVEAAKFDVGQDDRTGGDLAAVDEGLADLPVGYGESQIMLLPRDPQWAYAYWDIPNEQKEELRRQGGQQLALRIYDVTDMDLGYQSPHSIQEYPCDELAREWYLPIPVSDRDYVIEIGYRCADGRWLVLARSEVVRIPPIYPSDWIEDSFLTIAWEEELEGKTFLELVPPSRRMAAVGNAIYDQIFSMSESAEAKRMAGSIFGSMHQVPAGSEQQVAGSIQHVPGSGQQAVSSYVLASGAGMWAGAPTESGVGMSGVGMSGASISERMSGVGMSGVGMSERMSGIGVTMSGVGLTTSGAAISERMSGVGMSGAGISERMSGIGLTMSGVGMSGVGISERMSGVGMGMSGVGMTMSGAGISERMSGVGMSGAAISERMSGVGMGMSGVGMTMSGVGISERMSGVGMSGIGMTMSGAGISERMSGVGMTMSGVGMGMSGVGMTMSGAGISERMSGVGMTMSGVGMGMSGVGMTMSGVGMGMSGVGMTMSGVGIPGLTMSGAGLTMSGVGMTMSGVGMGMSGVGMTMSGVGMSGVGFSGSLPVIRPRQFWLIADAELIVYGATEPDATVTIGGRPVKLNPDGTFRFQMSFQDGLIDFPIMAVAVDGEQTREIHMKFVRETPARRTNTKEEAVQEWLE